VELTVHGRPEASAQVKRDGANRVVFRREQWCPDPREPGEDCHSPQSLALTTNVVELKSGRILEADIEVNAVDYVWTDLVLRPGAVPHGRDLQNALTHELGHFLGFAHSCRLTPGDPSSTDDQGRPVPDCADASAEALASTLRPDVSETDVERRTLTDDDQRGACDVYPRGITQGQTLVASGGCNVGTGRPPHFLLVLVLALVLGPRRALRASRARARGGNS
jgi:hypothetical protein